MLQKHVCTKDHYLQPSPNASSLTSGYPHTGNIHQSHPSFPPPDRFFTIYILYAPHLSKPLCNIYRACSISLMCACVCGLVSEDLPPYLRRRREQTYVVQSVCQTCMHNKCAVFSYILVPAEQ